MPLATFSEPVGLEFLELASELVVRIEELLFMVLADGFDCRMSFLAVCVGLDDKDSSLLSSFRFLSVLPPGETWLVLLFPLAELFAEALDCIDGATKVRGGRSFDGVSAIFGFPEVSADCIKQQTCKSRAKLNININTYYFY